MPSIEMKRVPYKPDHQLTEITGQPDVDFVRVINHHGDDHVWRCTCCTKLQPAQAAGYWVASSAHFSRVNGYARLAYVSNQASSKSAWCLDCVLATKKIDDKFELPK